MQAHTGLLSEESLQRLQRHVTSYETAAAELASWQEEIKALQATVGPGEGRRISQSVRQLASLSAKRPHTDSQLEALKARAEEARSTLSHDAERRSSDAQRRIDAGMRAQRQLRHEVEVMVRDLVDQDSLPRWFITALGRGPRNGPSAEKWLDTAITLVIFRFDHGIDDALLPLGRMADIPSSATAAAAQLLQDCAAVSE